MNVTQAAAIAKKKGFVLSFSEIEQIYVLRDKRDDLTLMTYAPVTMSLLNEHTWREECNKLRRSADR